MAQIFNFSSGPAMLPAEVLKQAQQELRDWNGLGTSVMEVSHRGKEFIQVAVFFRFFKGTWRWKVYVH